MDIWIIRDGEKHGPLRDYDVRGKISAGELSSTTMAWHEGMAEWQPLAKIAIFAKEFEPPPLPPAPSGPVELPARMKPAERLYLGRRFWARGFDLMLYSAAFWLFAYALGSDIGEMLKSSWVAVFHFVPWFVVETMFLHATGTTPGKWLLGLSVRNLDGSRLDTKKAALRSVRVMFAGIGLGLPYLSVLCVAISWFISRRVGNALWDLAGGHRVSGSALQPIKVFLLVGGFFGAMMLQNAVLWPSVSREMIKAYPQLKPLIEQSEQFYFPPKSRPAD